MRALLLAALLATGCPKDKAKQADPGPTCPQVVDNLVKIFGASISGHEDMQLINRDQEIARCEQRKTSREERICLHQAKDKNDLAACGKFRRRDREEQPPPPRAPIAPAGSAAGSGSAAAPASGSAGSGGG